MAGTEVYLGDAVYASWDGYHIALTANPGGNEQAICLEPAVWENLRLFVEAIPPGASDGALGGPPP